MRNNGKKGYRKACIAALATVIQLKYCWGKNSHKKQKTPLHLSRNNFAEFKMLSTIAFILDQSGNFLVG